MKEYQLNFLHKVHSFHKVNFLKLVPELNPSEHMLINALLDCEFGKCANFTEGFDINPNETKGVKVSELAKSIHTTMPGVSRMLSSLEDKGIIERRIDSSDRRNTLVFITKDGADKIKGYKQRLDAYLDIVFERFGEENVVKLIELITLITEISEEELNVALSKVDI